MRPHPPWCIRVIHLDITEVMFMDQRLFMEQDFIITLGTMVFITIIITLMDFPCVTIHGMDGVLDLDLALLTFGTVIPIGEEDIITGDLLITDHLIMEVETTDPDLLIPSTREEAGLAIIRDQVTDPAPNLQQDQVQGLQQDRARSLQQDRVHSLQQDRVHSLQQDRAHSLPQDQVQGLLLVQA